ncbi:MAG: hypothetical protein IVW55_02555 [Chloroflexi bacterium]|nr:hypothetical protein [Chloroflexota bacterium]
MNFIRRRPLFVIPALILLGAMVFGGCDSSNSTATPINSSTQMPSAVATQVGNVPSGVSTQVGGAVVPGAQSTKAAPVGTPTP